MVTPFNISIPHRNGFADNCNYIMFRIYSDKVSTQMSRLRQRYDRQWEQLKRDWSQKYEQWYQQMGYDIQEAWQVNTYHANGYSISNKEDLNANSLFSLFFF